MRYTAKDAKRMREMFSKAENGKPIEIEVDGDDLEIVLCAEIDGVFLNVPYNEDGKVVSVRISNAVLKRWTKEAKEAKSIIRRALGGERGTAYREAHGGLSAKMRFST